MPKRRTSLWLRQNSFAGADPQAEDLHLEWVGHDGVARPAGRARHPGPVHVETSSPGGEFARTATTPPLRIRLGAARGAAALRVRRGGEVLAHVDALALAHPTPRPPDRVINLGAAAGWRLAVAAERFDDPADFEARCQGLFQFIAGRPPFNDAAVLQRFGLVGLYWASDPVTGLFGATDDKINGRLLYGVESDVVAFVKAAHVAANKTLVLINSGHRAGAGGFDSRRPSWCAITSAPGEPWEAVALHELGHAFGLADEYEDPVGATPEKPHLEPNVSREKDPRRCGWSAMVTVAAPPVPTVAHGAATGLPADAVGTFEGARYRAAGRYRPSLTCLMRSTNADFCPVCQAAIRRGLGGP